jgi:phosphoribosylaminoimidazolecarboxamide formyltransferase/IMP cyclohydrolase
MHDQRLQASKPPSLQATLVSIRRALISVSDKKDLVPFARALADMGVEIISTGGTASALHAAGVKVTPIDQVTGFPEMMDGRVKTLHPKIHGGLLARRDLATHTQAMQQHQIKAIDLVCVNLYPFEKVILEQGISDEQAIENIDIGGPAMLRSASKNFQFVTVVTSTDQYDRVIGEMQANGSATTFELRRDLAAAAFTRTAEYDTAISAWMGTRRPEPFPAMLRLSYSRVNDLRYGENPHQAAAVYRNPASAEPSVVSAEFLHGKELSFNNLNDAAAALELVQELSEVFPDSPGAAIIKHANPCGCAVATSLQEAFERAYEGDPLAAYGGILALNRPVDLATAQRIVDGQKFLEVIIAPNLDGQPAYAPDALDLLRERWGNVRILAVNGIRHTGLRKINYHSIPGGMLVQERDMKLADIDEWRQAAGPRPDDATLRDAAFAWTLAKHLKSNAIAIARGGQLLGAGMGQVDRVTSCRLAIERAGPRLKASSRKAQAPSPRSQASGLVPVAASDAFFPFPDGPQLLIDSGVKCIVHPGGSKRDQETIDLCERSGVTLLVTGTRHFRH